MHKQRSQQVRNQKQIFDSQVPTFHSYSQENDCPNCATYEEDIAILQDKLMETHNKLIQQIDICRDQEVKTIQLMKTRQENQQNMLNGGNLREKGSGKLKKVGKINHRNYEEQYQYQHSFEPLVEAKTQLLRNDLEAMRNKVLAEIVKSNKLQELNRQIEQEHGKQIMEFRERIRKLELSRNKLIDSNENIKQQCASLQQQLKAKQEAQRVCSCGFQQKYFDLDQAFMNQRTVMNQLLQQNNGLQNQLYDRRVREQEHHERDHQEIRTQPKKKRGMEKEKNKQQFEQTKNLIKKLQLAEKQTRTRKAQERYGN